MTTTFKDELNKLLDLIRYKRYYRSGDVLYVRYDYFKPECTISELVWGFCVNPCYAKRLTDTLLATLPDYPMILSVSGQNISNDTIQISFDDAMRIVCSKDQNADISFSNESTSKFDNSSYNDQGEYIERFSASDDDGEIWYGLRVDEFWLRAVDQVYVYFTSSTDNNTKLWEHKYNGQHTIEKYIKNRNDVIMFHPFKNPLPLLDLDMRLWIEIKYNDSPVFTNVQQIFGVCSTQFCKWLMDTLLEIRLYHRQVAYLDFKNKAVTFTTLNR